MTTLDVEADGGWLDTKGAPEAVQPRCVSVLCGDGAERPLPEAGRQQITQQVKARAQKGLRVLALARRATPATGTPPPREQGRA